MTPLLGRLAKAAIVLEVVLGLGAVGGGLALIVGPRGEVIPLPVSALAGSPFATYLLPGVILFVVLGVGPLVAAWLALRRSASAPVLAFAVGGALIIWIGVEIAIVGYSNEPPLQALYLGLGVVISVVGGVWMVRSRNSAIGHRRRVDSRVT
jgi:hypothetical protein